MMCEKIANWSVVFSDDNRRCSHGRSSATRTRSKDALVAEDACERPACCRYMTKHGVDRGGCKTQALESLRGRGVSQIGKPHLQSCVGFDAACNLISFVVSNNLGRDMPVDPLAYELPDQPHIA